MLFAALNRPSLDDDPVGFFKAGIGQEFKEALFSLSLANPLVWESMILVICILIFRQAYKERNEDTL